MSIPTPTTADPAPPVSTAFAAGVGEGSQAAADATETALAGVHDPKLVLVFATGSAQTMADQAEAAAGSVPVFGLTGDACIGGDGRLENGCCALALGSPLRLGSGVVLAAGRDLRAAGRTAAQAALTELGRLDDHTVLLLFFDARSGDGADLIAGAYEVAGGSIALAGGAATGSQPNLFCGGIATPDAVAAVAISSRRPIGVGFAHACVRCATPAIVTAAEGHTVLELDGQRAADVYLEHLGLFGEPLTEAEFVQLAAIHPMAQPELHGTLRPRRILGRTATGGLLMGTTIAPNAAVYIAEQSPDRIVATTALAIERACKTLAGEPAQAALFFDCTTRQQVLGTGLNFEAGDIGSGFGGAQIPVGGVYTGVQIARRRGAQGDRNHAVVVVAFG